VNSIRWKLVLTSALLVFLPVYFLNRYAIEAFDRFTREALEEEMISHAMMLGEQYKVLVLAARDDGALDDAFGDMVRLSGSRLKSQFTILTPDGRVHARSGTPHLADNDVKGLPEVARALGGRYGARNALTEDRQYMYYYIALPVVQDGKLVAVVHVARHTGPIIKAIKRMTQGQRLAMFSALGLAILASAVLALTLTRRLRLLTRASMDYARGDAAMDIRIRGRDEIGELARAFNHMTAEIEKRSRYNRDMISTVMHELRAPLTAIKGACEVLDQGAADNPEARRKFLSNIVFETDRMTRMVRQLGKLTELDTEDLRGKKQTVDYVETVRKIVERLVPAVPPGSAHIEVSLPDDAIAVRIFPDRIQQVIANLVENAVRYTPADGRIELAVEPGPARCVTTTVRDTGCGIAEANIGRLFDRFFTTEPKDRATAYGSGLGLAIARSIVENHQGSIRAESQAGAGAAFIFTLPVAE
jgi:two-component system, OmpR family, sensor histidine kinase ChvG